MPDSMMEGRIREIARKYPEPQAAVLPSLYAAQEENGFISDEAIRVIAQQLGLAEAEVYGTATFYALLLWKSAGRHVISICHNLPCSLLGAEPLIKYLKQKLGVEEGQVTVDGRFSIRRIECIGRCDSAPAMLVDEDYHGELTPLKIDEILETYE